MDEDGPVAGDILIDGENGPELIRTGDLRRAIQDGRYGSPSTFIQRYNSAYAEALREVLAREAERREAYRLARVNTTAGRLAALVESVGALCKILDNKYGVTDFLTLLLNGAQLAIEAVDAAFNSLLRAMNEAIRWLNRRLTP